jgi:hypothetical protein
MKGRFHIKLKLHYSASVRALCAFGFGYSSALESRPAGFVAGE